MSAHNKLHKIRSLSYVSDAENNWTLCQRHVADRRFLAAFDAGVTCKNCLAILKFREDEEATWKARREAKK